MLTWLTVKKEYEGFPLFIRRPAALDVDLLRSIHPTLAVVTHEFIKRRPNGLPEPDYNESLIEMDMELVRAFDVDQMGVPVLVETFGGKRHYYFYVAADTDVSTIISKIARRYPEERLSWTVRPDLQWGFFEKYARDHFRDDFPDDADGDALRKVRDSGSNMAKPHVFDFHLCFSDEATARRVADLIPAPASIHEVSQEDDGRWTCFCRATLIPSYEAVIALDRRLETLCKQHGGDYEGWGTFGDHDIV